MKKENSKFLACADLHLRDSIPVSRIDDYWKVQEKKFIYLINKAIELNCDIYCAGDLFHKAKSSSFLEAWVIGQLQRLKAADLKFITITGQHDLPNHNINEIDKSSIWVLREAEVIDLHVVPYNDGYVFEDLNMMLIHTMMHKDQLIHRDIKSTRAVNLLKKNLDIKIIISGDNHQSFVEKYQGRFLINCGSMMRMAADQIDHIPKFYVLSLPTMECTEVPYPIKKNVFDISHIEKEKERDNRIETFVNRINSDYEINLSFTKNLENFISKNKIRKGVQNKVWEAVNE